MRHLTTGLVILTFLAGQAIGEQEPFLGYEGRVYGNPITRNFVPPTGLVEGDFNEDGIEDYATFRSDFTRVLIGNGDCTFAVTYFPIFFGGSGAIGDFNEDGHQDLAMGNQGSGVVVVLGNGDGTFGPPVTYDAPYQGQVQDWAVRVGDFNEDGDEDLVMGWNALDTGFAFFAGNGDGTFDAPVMFGDGSGYDIAIADFNEDNHLDLMASNCCGGSTTAKVWLGTGNGAFADAGSYDVGDDPFDLVVFDFDGDTHLDFATANIGSDNVSVRLGNGDGTFDAETTYAVSPEPYFLTVGDVDSDGNEDLLVGYTFGPNEGYVSLLAGNGDGTFDPEVQVPTLHSPGPMLLSDLDDDGYLDLVVSSNRGTFFVMPGLGDGTFDWPGPALVISEAPGSGVAAALGDMDNDGLQDAVLVRDPGANTVTVRLADGDGSFSVSATAALTFVPNDVALADVNNDTDLDVLVPTESDRFVVYPGNGDGTLGPPTIFEQKAEVIATGLFDADANVDVAAVTTSAGPQIDILLGNGNGTFTFDGAYGVGPDPSEIDIGDFNEDNKTDLVVRVYNSGSGRFELSVLLGVGDGTFQTEVRYTPDIQGSWSFLVIDADEDGHQDLAIGSNVLYGAGDGTFGAATPTDSGIAVTVVADANGDGRNDHVGVASPWVELALRQEDGSFAVPQITAFLGFGPAIVEDANGDGRNDVIVGAWYITQDVAGVAVALNVEPTPFNFALDKATMNWPAVTGALSYNVYRGLISSLIDGDSDGLPDGGYGDCQNALDPDTTDLYYVDASIPPAGDGYFYLIAAVDWAGERYLGRTSDGLARFPGTPCP